MNDILAPILYGTDRWVSVGKDLSQDVGRYRHIVARGHLTSVCGASASTPDVWRGDTRKPVCPSCAKMYGRRENR